MVAVAAGKKPSLNSSTQAFSMTIAISMFLSSMQRPTRRIAVFALKSPTGSQKTQPYMYFRNSGFETGGPGERNPARNPPFGQVRRATDLIVWRLTIVRLNRYQTCPLNIVLANATSMQMRTARCCSQTTKQMLLGLLDQGRRAGARLSKMHFIDMSSTMSNASTRQKLVQSRAFISRSAMFPLEAQ